MEINYSDNTWARYADDAVIHFKSKEEAEKILENLNRRFNECRLELHPDKTKIIYCKDADRTEDHPNTSFDFLGYTFDQEDSIKNAKRKISDKAKQLAGENVRKLIDILNPITLGNANYWSPTVAKRVFSEMDSHIWKVQYKFLQRLHPNKSWQWISQRYYKPDKTGQSRNN